MKRPPQLRIATDFMTQINAPGEPRQITSIDIDELDFGTLDADFYVVVEKAHAARKAKL